MLIPTMTPVDSPLAPIFAGLGDGDTGSLIDVASGTWEVVAEEVDGIADEEVVADVADVAEVEVVEAPDEVVDVSEEVVDNTEVAVLVSDSGREEARIQK